KLELRRVGAGGAGEFGLSRVHAHWRPEGTRCQDSGEAGASNRAGGDRGSARAAGGAGARAGSGKRPEAARGHHRGGDKHSLPDRQQLAGGWRASADAYDEEDREAGGGLGKEKSRPGAGGEEQRGGFLPRGAA